MIIVNTVVCGIFPLMESYLQMGDWGVNIALITSDVFFYPFMGYYIEKCDFEKISTKKNLLFCVLMSILGVGLCVYFTLQNLWYRGIATQEFMGVFQLYIALFVYILAKKLNGKVEIKGTAAKIITGIGMCTFGVYLVHGLVYVALDDFLTARSVVFTYPLSFARATAVFVLSMVIVWICRKIPVVKQLF